MAKQEKEIERWVTMNGVRVPIFKDGSVGGPKALRDKVKAKNAKVEKLVNENFKTAKEWDEEEKKNKAAKKKSFDKATKNRKQKAEQEAKEKAATAKDKKNGVQKLVVDRDDIGTSTLVNAEVGSKISFERESWTKIGKDKWKNDSTGKIKESKHVYRDGIEGESGMEVKITSPKKSKDTGTTSAMKGNEKSRAKKESKDDYKNYENTFENRQKLKKQIDDYRAAHKVPTAEDRRIVNEMRDKYDSMVKEDMSRIKSKVKAEMDAKDKVAGQEKKLEELQQEHYKLSKAISRGSVSQNRQTEDRLTQLEKEIKTTEAELKKSKAQKDIANNEDIKEKQIRQNKEQREEAKKQAEKAITELQMYGKKKDGRPYSKKDAEAAVKSMTPEQIKKLADKRDERRAYKEKLAASSDMQLKKQFKTASPEQKKEIIGEMNSRGYSFINGRWVDRYTKRGHKKTIGRRDDWD